MHTRLGTLMAAVAFLCAAQSAPVHADSLWVHIGSKHWNGGDYNEINPGVGYERDLTRRLGLEGGIYKNSHERPSHYGWISYEFARPGRWHFRGMFGFADGYDGTKAGNGEAIPIAGLIIEYRRARVLNVPGVSALSAEAKRWRR